MTHRNSTSKHTFAIQKEDQNMIANIVKERRMHLKYTQQELADKSKLSLRSIQRIEKGEVIPRMHTLKALSDSLNISIDLLNRDTGTSKTAQGTNHHFQESHYVCFCYNLHIITGYGIHCPIRNIS